ncbi:hypothetical protein EI545_06275 [Tabrizicola piscis]|uniref:Uncharacterized protein n=1 Tax=Tabrizicola piscis TaxID=2494374 RepID=A0A3S8U4J7_9RHOB|nr:hypothetical protein [Tabrizicola piscis]AZL58470.1 hypothetical protein EI545_06275 [Tabrizicola piscis]
MPSIIVLTQELPATDMANIPPSHEQALLAGMKIFGNFHINNYDQTSSQTAAESLKRAFQHAITNGCTVYYWSNKLSRFVKLTNPTRSGVNINFTESEGGNFKIHVHLDEGGNNPKMNITMPIGDHTTYLDLFNALSAQDHNAGSIEFFAAATLISRCK